MISRKDLNTVIKTSKFLITVQLVIKKKIHENLIDMIMNYTGFFKFPKEYIQNMDGLLLLILNRIYYMYNNECFDWMNYYNNNNYQIILWNNNKFNKNKLNNLYKIISKLLFNFFNFNILLISNSNNDLILQINNVHFLLSLKNYTITDLHSIFEIIKNY